MTTLRDLNSEFFTELKRRHPNPTFWRVRLIEAVEELRDISEAVKRLRSSEAKHSARWFALRQIERSAEGLTAKLREASCLLEHEHSNIPRISDDCRPRS